MSEVKSVLAGVWNVSPEDIPEDAAINTFGAWDSLGHITVLLALSERFDFTLTPDNVQALTSLQAIEAFVAGEALQ